MFSFSTDLSLRLIDALPILAAYLLGCLNAGYYLVRFRSGLDVRDQGSGSTGATNAGRLLGRMGFTIVFLTDTLKGAAAVLTVFALGAGTGVMAAAAIAVVTGHIFPVQLGFRGGKGAATAWGTLIVFSPWIAAASFLLAGGTFLLLRHVVTAGLVAIILLPVCGWLLGRPMSEIATAGALSILLLVAHRSNIAEIFRSQPTS